MSQSWIRYRIDWLVDGRWGKGQDFDTLNEAFDHVNEVTDREFCAHQVVEIITTVSERVL